MFATAPRPLPRALALALPLLVLATLLGSCGGGEPAAPSTPGAGEAGGAPRARADEPRSRDPRLAQARAALAAGNLDAALTLTDQLGASAGVEGLLCRARALFRSGDPLGALTVAEEARALSPADSRVFATTAEFLALGRRGADAEDELTRGLELAGSTPDLARARAVLALTRPGQGQVALSLLLGALEADPELPYSTWPLSQAHFLTGRLVLGQGEAEAALEHGARALELDPDLAQAQELCGDALATAGDLLGAIVCYERAAEAGLDVDRALADAHLRAGMFARVDGEEQAAEDHYRKARELGLDDAQLGSAADFLRERADEAHRAGFEAGLRGEVEAAAALQARALELSPGHVGARHELASLRFRAGDYAGASLLWQGLFQAELAAGLDEGSHLNLARARVLGGQTDQAREALEAYLGAHPAGAFADATREMLDRLP